MQYDLVGLFTLLKFTLLNLGLSIILIQTMTIQVIDNVSVTVLITQRLPIVQSKIYRARSID